MYVLIDICMSYIHCLINIKINSLHFKLVIFSENETYIHICLIITFRSIIHYKIIEYY